MDIIKYLKMQKVSQKKWLQVNPWQIALSSLQFTFNLFESPEFTGQFLSRYIVTKLLTYVQNTCPLTGYSGNIYTLVIKNINMYVFSLAGPLFRYVGFMMTHF